MSLFSCSYVASMSSCLHVHTTNITSFLYVVRDDMQTLFGRGRLRDEPKERLRRRLLTVVLVPRLSYIFSVKVILNPLIPFTI